MSQYLNVFSLSPVSRGYIAFLLIIFAGEVIFHVVFAIVKYLGKLVGPRIKVHEVFKGIIERLMLSIGVAHGIPTVIIAFGALKVATKLSASSTTPPRSEEEVYNQNAYFLIGNVLSILFAIIYALIARHFELVAVKLG